MNRRFGLTPRQAALLVLAYIVLLLWSMAPFGLSVRVGQPLPLARLGWVVAVNALMGAFLLVLGWRFFGNAVQALDEGGSRPFDWATLAAPLRWQGRLFLVIGIGLVGAALPAVLLPAGSVQALAAAPACGLALLGVAWVATRDVPAPTERIPLRVEGRPSPAGGLLRGPIAIAGGIALLAFAALFGLGIAQGTLQLDPPHAVQVLAATALALGLSLVGCHFLARSILRKRGLIAAGPAEQPS